MENLEGEAFILKTISYSESDLILYALSKEKGVLHFFVKGAKNSKKRFSGGALQPPHLIYFQTSPLGRKQYDDGGLITLKEASLLNDFVKIRSDYIFMETLFSMIKVVLSSVTGHKSLFNHFGGALKILPTVKDQRRFFTHFVIRYLYIEGVLPLQAKFVDFIKTPLSCHKNFLNVSDVQRNREVRFAKHFLSAYSNSKENIKWPE